MTLFYPKNTCLFCHLTIAQSSFLCHKPLLLVSLPPLVAHCRCLRGSPFLTICSPLMPPGFCMWPSFHICTLGLHTHCSQLRFLHLLLWCWHLSLQSRPPPVLRPTYPTTQWASQSSYLRGTSNQPELNWTQILPSPLLSWLYFINGKTLPIHLATLIRNLEVTVNSSLPPASLGPPPTWSPPSFTL